MLTYALVGFGAIGRAALELLRSDAELRAGWIVVPERSLAATRELARSLAPEAIVTTRLGDTDHPDLVLECAGHAALGEHVLPALERGLACIVASVGALAEPGLVDRLEAAARRGGTRLELIAGAIGAIDALAAAKVGGLDRVVYTGRKPPQAWKGTPAEAACDLDALAVEEVIFRGSAGEAARLYPKNANVAATLALAGLGLARTEVRLVADPGVTENVHQVDATGAFGRFELTIRGRPLAANPKTSSLTVYSLVRAMRNRAAAVVI